MMMMTGSVAGLAGGPVVGRAGAAQPTAEISTAAQPAIRSVAEGRTLISVSGEGLVERAPDHVVISFGVTHAGESMTIAQSEVNARMTAVIAALTKLGLDRNAIQTDAIQLSPVFDYGRGGEEPEIKGYRATNSVRVMLREVDRASKVIDTGLAAGANQLNGVQFQLENDRPARRDALAAAARDANDKAAALAGALGLRIERLRDVQEEGASRPIPATMEMAAMASPMAGLPTPVQPGQLQIRARVTLVFEASGGQR